VVERILADQERRHVARDHAERSGAPEHRRRLANPVGTVVGDDAHEGAVLLRRIARRPGHMEGVDGFDLHAGASCFTATFAA
jgi:hypothetical protein